MPTYDFKDTNTDKEWTEFMSISEKESFLQANPHITQLPSSAFLGDPVLQGRLKPEGGFRDLLKDIKRKHHRSNINTW